MTKARACSPFKKLAFPFLTIFLGACASVPSSATDIHLVKPSSPPEHTQDLGASSLPPESIEAIRDIEKQIQDANVDIEAPNAEQPSPRKKLRPRIPLEVNEDVLRWIRYFTIQDRGRFQRFLQRGNMYKSAVREILRKNGVPTDLYYLAMIESGYVTHARSRAHAVGVWQFMRATGKRYGLNQNYYVDERRDVLRATEAAAKYLRNLNIAFQSWYLAIAGYNAGEGRILSAIMRGGSRDFWDLVEKKALPPETRNYVPKFLAAVIIGKHPEKYGFHDIDSPEFPKAAAVPVAGGVRLSDIARLANVQYATLKDLNPGLIRSVTPPSSKSYFVWIPENKAALVKSLGNRLARLRIRSTRRIASASRSGFHRSRRGKSRDLIARRFGHHHSVTHHVRSGEALSMISERYGVPVSRLKRLNDLRSSRIYAGQTLVIRRGI